MRVLIFVAAAAVMLSPTVLQATANHLAPSSLHEKSNDPPSKVDRLQFASRLELPIQGVFGDPAERGCRSYRRQEEGAYVSFNRGGGTGEGGEGGCDYTGIKQTARAEYLLTGTCWAGERSKARVKETLVVISRNEIVYQGRRQLRCR